MAHDLPGVCTLNDDRCRIDKWLWAARFFKTRALAADEVDRGRVLVNDAVVKRSRELHVGDRVSVRQGPLTRRFEIAALSNIRGPAPQAQALYCETADSIAAREAFAAARRNGLADPGSAIEHGRPTKRDRRNLADWQRWSAVAGDDDEKD